MTTARGIRKGTSITPAEAKVLDLMCIGLITKVAADRLGIAEKTANAHIHNAKVRTGAKTLAHLCVIYDRLKLLEGPA